MTRSRQYGRVSAPDVPKLMDERSVLVLPVGSHEQHGPHLPLNTDTVIAHRFTELLVQEYGEAYDLWALPTMPYGLSLEHAWSPGTISLRLTLLANLLDTLIGEYVRATPARRLLIINGHGGNRGILEPIAHELQINHGVMVVIAHPSTLSTVAIDSELPEIHAGTKETSIMLALSPADVHLDRLNGTYETVTSQREDIERLVLGRGATWPWSSGNPAIATDGITGGDPRKATPELGKAIVSSALQSCEAILNEMP